MRANKIVHYESIVGVLREPGCPICRFVKNYQAALLQEPSAKDIQSLCNFHTWGLAATQRAPYAARLLETLLKKETAGSIPANCDICVLLELEEDRRIREFISVREHTLVVQWLRSEPTLCVPHGIKLKRDAPQTMAATIGTILERSRSHLLRELTRLRQDVDPDATKWGVLGHAAEFLVAQRGLRR